MPSPPPYPPPSPPPEPPEPALPEDLDVQDVLSRRYANFDQLNATLFDEAGYWITYCYMAVPGDLAPPQPYTRAPTGSGGNGASTPAASALAVAVAVVAAVAMALGNLAGGGFAAL